MISGWSDVKQGRRELDWNVVVGDVDNAAYRTPLGRQAVRQAMVGLSEFFGAGWLSRAANPRKAEDRIALGEFSPSLFSPVREQRRPFVTLMSLWARLQLLVNGHTEGISLLRNTLRSNPARIEFRHAVAQARLAAQAHLLGARVTLEPLKSDRTPGDVRAVRGGTDLFLEYQAIDVDLQAREHAARMEEAIQFLLFGSTGERVTWSGELPMDPDEGWRTRIRKACEECIRTGAPVEVITDDAVLRCTPGVRLRPQRAGADWSGCGSTGISSTG